MEEAEEAEEEEEGLRHESWVEKREVIVPGMVRLLGTLEH